MRTASHRRLGAVALALTVATVLFLTVLTGLAVRVWLGGDPVVQASEARKATREVRDTSLLASIVDRVTSVLGGDDHEGGGSLRSGTS